MAEEKRKVGRPSDYREEYAEQVTALARLGATNEEIADFFGVSRQTLDTWGKKYPEFLDALKAGKLAADMEVADKLYQRATGYSWSEEQAIKVKCGQHEERVEVVEVRRELPPDTTAAIFWLKNRRKHEWRDKQDIEHSGNVEITKIERQIVDAAGDGDG